jgi:hypothetical protein
MKKIIFILQLIVLQSLAADWPGTGTCSTTLQACIDAVADGGTVNVVTDTPISTGTYAINKGLTLQAGDGFHPRFSNITLVLVAPPSGKNVTIQGFEFHGFAYIDMTLTINNEINIKNNKWLEPDLGSDRFEGVQVKVSAALIIGSTATFNFIGNDIQGAGSNGAFGFVDVFNNQTGTLKANIIDNHFDIDNAGTINPAIFITNAGNGEMDVQMVANQLKAKNDFLVFQQGNIGAQEKMNIGVISNLFTGGRNLGTAVAVNDLIKSEVTEGTFNGIFANNTLDGGGGTSIGLNFLNHTPNLTSSINISKNIIVNTNKAYQGPASGTSINVSSSGYNVFFNEGTITGLSLAVSDVINQDPLFVKGGINYALQAGSPAIDKADIVPANTLYTTGFMQGSPRIDADGLRRYKGDKIDSGAFEWGDRHLFHKTDNAFFNSSASLDAAFNNDATARTIVTAVWNYENLPGIYHDHPIGIYRSGSIWGVVNEDQVSLPTDVKFHIFYPYGVTTSGTFLNGLYQWTKDATIDTGFDLNSSLLNNNTQAGVFASNFWDGNNSPVYNPHSLEVGYKFTTNKWFLANSDGVNMPTNAKVFTYNQDYSRNVFNHKVTIANTQGNVTVIDHPLLNGNPCALPTVTQFAPFGFLGPVFGNNPHHIGVFYAGSIAKWAIFNQDLMAFNTTALGAASFNVMVDPQQIYECNTKILFADGFE